MKSTKEYLILVNDKPFFTVSHTGAIAAVKDEAQRRNPAAKVEIAMVTIEPYEASASDDLK